LPCFASIDQGKLSLRDFGKITEIKSPRLPAVRGLLSLAVGVVVVAALVIAKEVFIPITVAILLSFVLAPLVTLLVRIRVPRVIAVLISALLAVVFFAMLGSVIGSQFAGLAQNLPRYAMQIERKVTTLRQETIGRFPFLEKSFPDHILPRFDGKKAAAPQSSDVPSFNPPAREESDPTSFAVSILLPVLAPVTEAAIICIVAIFILVQKNDLRDRIIRLFGTHDLHRTTIAMNEAARRLSHYFLAQLAVNTGFGFVVGCGLAIIGVPSAMLFGILAGILRYVPYVGVLLAAALPAALAAAASPEWAPMWWTLALVGVAELITGQFVEPFVYGNTTGLSPLSIVVATIFWTWLWGPIGLVLATPLTLCLVVLGRYVEPLEFLDVLFGDQPALTPVENFYQRMLAHDPDEALHQADILLKENSLSTYYDDVAINGLRLAAYDAERGVLQPDDVAKLKESVLALVEDLDDYDEYPSNSSDGLAPPKTGTLSGSESARAAPVAPVFLEPTGTDGPARVICIPGRGVFDDIVAQIFVQLLRKRNIAARLEPPGFGAKRHETADDMAGSAIICAMYLEIRNNLTAARALVRRLRHRRPEVQIVLGIWAGDSKDEAPIDSSSEDICAVNSLQQGLAQCVELVSTARDRPVKMDETALYAK
jgi:predicted PurR-regulated permease PerM